MKPYLIKEYVVFIDLSFGRAATTASLQVLASLPALKANFGNTGHRITADALRADASGTSRASLVKAVLNKSQVKAAVTLLCLLCHMNAWPRKLHNSIDLLETHVEIL